MRPQGLPPWPRITATPPGTMMKRFAGLGSALAGVMFVWRMLHSFLPRGLFDVYVRRLFDYYVGRFARRHALPAARFLDPYLTVTVGEYDGAGRMTRGEVYDQAKAYLANRCAGRARSLRAERPPGVGGDRFVLSMGDDEEVADEFRGATVWWHHSVPRSGDRRTLYHASRQYGGGIMAGADEEDPERSYRLVFHERHRELVVDEYLPHVCREGRALMTRHRRRKLYTNTGDRYGRPLWTCVVFNHPSTFETLAMDPAKKQCIMDDLDAFRNGKEYYTGIGKAWKRGYLLYGPPGTGKSTMIAAMANYLDYHIYDIELSSVANNTELRRLFIGTKGKSIIVIEDIDCSGDLTSKRTKKTPPGATADNPDHTSRHAGVSKVDEAASKVTLSGLLNAIDGLWSSCGGERIFILTTNHVEKLDPALIRRGRMDKHIEMSYCCFEAFKFLAKNYLGMDAHPLFDTIGALLQGAKIPPADVAEHLMRKCAAAADVESCLASLVKTLEKATAKNSIGNLPKDKKMVEEARRWWWTSRA